jgi:2-dehydropantoate 2-reductase
MRFIIFGAGAIGGVIGGRLHEHGRDVILIARGRHFEALRDGGLVLQSPEGAVTLPIPVVDDPGTIRFQPGDVVILAMKSQDTAAALVRLAAAADHPPAVVCAQNGVENERLALRSFADVYGMYVMMPATHLEPGLVEASSTPVSGVLDVGRYPSGVDGVAEDVAAALEASTFKSRAVPAIMRWKYAKLLTNLGNAVEAACGLQARSSALFELAVAEGRACLDAAGIDAASDDEQQARRGEFIRIRPVEGRRREGGSSWQSLARGAGTVETDWLNGEVVLLGRTHGVDTPVNALLQQVAARMARDGMPPGSFTVAELLSQLG